MCIEIAPVISVKSITVLKLRLLTRISQNLYHPGSNLHNLLQNTRQLLGTTVLAGKQNAEKDFNYIVGLQNV